MLVYIFQEKEEKLDGDAALNKFFRDIYKDADEDTRKAMTKSFVRLSISIYIIINFSLDINLMKIFLFMQVESNGTVLSTNWKEVGSKKVEGSPPDGMEMRKWEY